MMEADSFSTRPGQLVQTFEEDFWWMLTPLATYPGTDFRREY
jgi:hypothetical protein